jgi:hypothetical protein
LDRVAGYSIAWLGLGEILISPAREREALTMSTVLILIVG